MTSTSLNEIVYFEFDEPEPAQRLCSRLGRVRLAWVEPGDTSPVVGVVLSSQPEDLAHLLRDVEAWLADEELGPIPFELDGRIYQLQPRRTHSREAA